MRLRMFATILVGASLAAFGCGGDGPTGGGGGNGGGGGGNGGGGGGGGAGDVTMGDNFFDPEGITIDAGTTLTWANEGSDTHTATPDDSESWDDQDVTPDQSFSVTFDEPGVYYYHCIYHGAPGDGSSQGAQMAGTVTVQ